MTEEEYVKEATKDESERSISGYASGLVNKATSHLTAVAANKILGTPMPKGNQSSSHHNNNHYHTIKVFITTAIIIINNSNHHQQQQSLSHNQSLHHNSNHHHQQQSSTTTSTYVDIHQPTVLIE